MGLTFEVLRQANQTRLPTIHDACNDWNIHDWYLATNGEWGEFQNLFKKVRRRDFSLTEIKEKLGKELADVVTYLDILHHFISHDKSLFTKWPSEQSIGKLGSTRIESTSHLCTRVSESFGHLARTIMVSDKTDIESYCYHVTLECQTLMIRIENLALRLDIDLGLATALKFNEVSERIGSSVKIEIN